MGDQEPRTQASAGESVTHLAHMDDLVLVAESPLLRSAVSARGLLIKDEKLSPCGAISLAGASVFARSGAHRRPASRFWAAWSLGTTKVRCVIASFWFGEFWARKKHLCTRAVAPGLRLQRLQSEILPVLLWGAPSWQMHKRTDDEV